MAMTLAQQATASTAEHCDQHGMNGAIMTTDMSAMHSDMQDVMDSDDMDCCETECQCPQDLCHSAPSLISHTTSLSHLLADTPRFSAQVREPVTISTSLFRPPIHA